MTLQRVYRAPCPGCGAPVDFHSAQSTYAVCSYCQSTVVRDGETLSRAGRMAELFDDHSPLQLGVTGRSQGRAFTLVGRLQYAGSSGRWTEWVAMFDDGGTALLAEDNGAYVFTWPAAVGRELPPAAQLRVGATTAIDGKSFEVAANDSVRLVSAQGELPKLPPLNAPFAMAELRSADGEVLAIDYGSTPPSVTRGRGVRLEELALAGLREENAKAVQGRHFACPHCGAPVEVKLAGSKSITCPACRSIVELGSGLGGELRHAEQETALQPLIPLGTVGQLQGAHWQVVGYQHRLGWLPGEDDDRFGWDEYLLYNAKRGFLFLVDSSDGWSVVKTATGAPSLSANGQTATYLGTQYRLKESYEAQTTYVAGEFYWPVERGQRSFLRDFAGRNGGLLSMEETPRERTWSVGSQVSSDTVAKAFNIADKRELLKRGDSGPTSPAGGGGGLGCGTIMLILLVILILFALLRACDDETRSGTTYRGTGGSYGGYSSGGSHK